MAAVRANSPTSRIACALEERIRMATYADGSRLPPERDLAVEFGTSRSTIRKALARLEAQGLVWRHVGKGTFVGRPPQDAVTPHIDITATPREIIEARLGIEPLIAGYAALSASRRDIELMWRCVERIEDARDWTTYEQWDCTLHRAIAVSTQNVVFVSFLETINHLRQGELWTRTTLPDLNSEMQRANTAMHRRIVEAIAQQGMRRAVREMRTHLDKLRQIYLEVPILFDTISEADGLIGDSRPDEH